MMVTFGGEGRICGAVYVAGPVPGLVIVPSVELPPGTPLTVQRTARFGLPELVIVAVNCCVAPSSTLAEAGVTLRTMSLVIVTVALALLEVSAWLVAVTVTLADEGRFCGAV